MALLRRRRFGTPTWSGDEEAEEMLRQAEGILPSLRRKEQELFPNMDLETGLIMEQPIQRTPPFVPEYEPGANLQTSYGGQDNVTPLVRPRKMTPTWNPNVSSPIDDSMIDGSTVIKRPESSIIRATNEPYDLGGGSTYSGTYNSVDESGRVEPRAIDATLRRRVDPLTDSLRKEEDIIRNPRKVSRKEAAMMGFFQGLASGGLVGGATGALFGALKPGALQRMRQQQELGEVGEQIDNRLQREERAARVDYLRQRPGFEQQRIANTQANQQSLAVTREQNAFLNRMKLQGGFKRGTNPQVDAEADRLFGQGALGDFDATKDPTFKQSNGMQYQYNRQTGKFEPAEGIPQDEGAKRIPWTLSDGRVVNIRQDTAATVEAAQQARAIARADRQEQQTYQRGRDQQQDQKYETQRRQTATSQLRTLYGLYRQAEQAANYGDEKGRGDAEALRREADLLAADLEATYGSIEGVRDAIQKAKGPFGNVRSGASVTPK